MYKSFTELDSLFSYIKEEKDWEGAETSHRNRYPIRFILFDNFVDFNEFVNERPVDIFTFSLNNIIDKDFPDIFPTFTELSAKIREYIKNLPASDHIIYPFSEMTRFYSSTEFQSLVKTIKGINPPAEGQKDHLRIYIPIVGMQGKMGAFMEDKHTYVWEYKSPKDNGTYNLILSESTYGITGFEKTHSIVNNLCEWLQLWEKGENVKQNIICTSPNIFGKAHNAQPDNAFQYTQCDNAFEFLTKGLKLDFGGIRFKAEEIGYWEQLANRIDVENFDFQQFINEKYGTHSLHTSANFIKTWFECETDFDRWLLVVYFIKENNGNGYVCNALTECSNLSTTELFSIIATKIFDTAYSDSDITERNNALKEALHHNVELTEYAEKELCTKLSEMLCSEEQDVKYKAKQLLTSLTESERRLIIENYGRGVVERKDIETKFPQLFNYTAPIHVQLSSSNSWIVQYFDKYRLSKINNNADGTMVLLSSKNSNTTSFQQWCNEIKTVKTILHDRNDIDVFYWIDGLGVDWIPFISAIVKEHSKENVYLNEIYIARAFLPTTTSVNKQKLLELVPDGRLDKIGDLDSFAHQCKSAYPQYIIDEMAIVEKAISTVLARYNGKKIAFVSDHGMSYLAQYGKGLSLAGVESNHEGRVAVCTSEKAVSDSKYIILEDGKTLCSLTYDSLAYKTPQGHGAHGGATPEEILVPIIIVSNQPNESKYSVNIIDKDVLGNNPVVKFDIRGLNSIDKPIVEYNNSTYFLFHERETIFVSEKLALVDTATRVTVEIGDYKKQFNIHISSGAFEDADLFNF